MQDLIAGRIDYLCEIVSTAKPQIEGGKVKALAIMTKTRSPVLPKLATTLEQGTDVQAYTWNAIFLPKGTPADIVKKLKPALRPYRRTLIALRWRFDSSARVKMIQRREAHSLACCDLAVSTLHVGDDSRVVFHDMAVTIDNSAAELA